MQLLHFLCQQGGRRTSALLVFISRDEGHKEQGRKESWRPFFLCQAIFVRTTALQAA